LTEPTLASQNHDVQQPTDHDAATPRHLRDRYAIVGVGETPYTRGSGRTTRALATLAVRNAIEDAGLRPGDVDGMMSYSFGNDSTSSMLVAGDLGVRLNFYMDVSGGGSSTEALVGIAIGVIEAGMCSTMAIFRAMNGYSQLRVGGTGKGAEAPITGDSLHDRVYGLQTPAQRFSHTFMRHMHEYGTTPEQVAMVKVIHSEHASNNPKAFYKQRVTVGDVLSSRMIVAPLHLLDCCVETDNGTAIIVTSAERALDLRHPPALIQAVVGRCCKPRADNHYQYGPITRVGGYYGRERLWSNAGVGPEDIDVTGSYDAFTFTTLLQLARRAPAEQHQRRAPVRGLHPRRQHGGGERAPAPRRRRRLVPAGRGRAAAPHLRLSRGRLPAGPRRALHREHGLGYAGVRVGDGDALRHVGGRLCLLQWEGEGNLCPYSPTSPSAEATVAPTH
jgi:acetyl-CoA acetyltransferase